MGATPPLLIPTIGVLWITGALYSYNAEALVYVDATFVVHALNLHDGLVGWGLQHTVISAGARVLRVYRST